jgi:hypothetical protein
MSAPDRRDPRRHALRQSIALLRQAEARAVETDLDLGVRITAALDALIESVRRDLDAPPTRIACPHCDADLIATHRGGVTTLERAP